MATYPKTAEELFKSDWKEKIRFIIFNFHLNEPIEDTLGDVFYFMVKRDYLAKWNPALGGSFSTYIYKFVANLCCVKHHRSHTVGGLAIEGARRLVTTTEDAKGSYVPGTVDEERIDVVNNYDTSNEVSYAYLVQSIERILAKPRYKEHSYGEWKGEQIPRSMLQVFRYIEREDLDVKEIAQRFQTSQEFVYSLVRKMQTVLRESHLSTTYDLKRYGKGISK